MPSFKIYLVRQWDNLYECFEIHSAYSTYEAAEAVSNAEAMRVAAMPPFTSRYGYTHVEEVEVDADMPLDTPARKP